MEVSLPENQESRLNELAIKTGRGTDELVQEAIARGEFIEEEEMDARIQRMLQS